MQLVGLASKCRLVMGVSLGGLPPVSARIPLWDSGTAVGGCLAASRALCPWTTPDGLCGRLAVGYTYHLASGGNREGGAQ